MHVLGISHTDLARAGVPEVDSRAEPHGQEVESGPVEEVEVEVVLELRGVQHFERGLGYLAGQSPRRQEELGTAATHSVKS